MCSAVVKYLTQSSSKKNYWAVTALFMMPPHFTTKEVCVLKVSLSSLFAKRPTTEMLLVCFVFGFTGSRTGCS